MMIVVFLLLLLHLLLVIIIITDVSSSMWIDSPDAETTALIACLKAIACYDT